MPKCPNCGRETYRTEDWACQWCGNPLLSGAFKIVPKTYRQIQEEKADRVKPVLEDEPELAPVTEVEPEPKIEPETPAPPEQVAEAAIEAEVKNETAPPPEPEAETIEEGEPTVPPEPVEAKEAAEPVAVPDSEAEPIAEVEPEVETAPASAPVAVPALEPDSATGTIDVTVEELNATLSADKPGANAKLMDKVLKVTGTVAKVFTRDNLDIYYIILAGAGGPSTWQVRCTFSREHSAYLSRLTEGQEATVQGTYAGYERNIILKECSLVQ